MRHLWYLSVLSAVTACAKPPVAPPLANTAHAEPLAEPSAPRPLSAEECEELRGHLVELGFPAEPLRYRDYAEGSPTEECERNVTREQHECSMRAGTIEQVEQCMVTRSPRTSDG